MVGRRRRQTEASPEGEHSSKAVDYDNQRTRDDMATLRENIRGILEHDPDALRIFEMMEADIDDVDPVTLRSLADEVASD